MKYRAGKRHVRTLHAPGHVHTQGPVDPLTLAVDECVIARRRDGWRCVRTDPEHTACERHSMYRHPNYWTDPTVVAALLSRVAEIMAGLEAIFGGVQTAAQRFAASVNGQPYARTTPNRTEGDTDPS
ncbi:hypothetical protein [Nocardia sp. CA-290969]|uniref:hypothetical protein n=1 Tax=Nocardia sp. CA-290969 TaxID=3239986 RepID=UPI003D8A3EFA